MVVKAYATGIYLFEINNGNTRTMCESCSKLTIKTPERRHYRRSSVSFFYQGLLSQTLTIHRTAGFERGTFRFSLKRFNPLGHSPHPLANIQTFICYFACEMTTTYF